MGEGAGPNVMAWLPIAIERVTVAVALPLDEPVPRIVNVVEERAAVGKPLMTPVTRSNLRPAGSPGLIE